VPNYLGQAILCTLLTPLIGVVAVIYALVARRRLVIGDIDGALRASHLARTWCWVSTIFFLVILLLIATGSLPARLGG
jgi:uncharacterized membrane protein